MALHLFLCLLASLGPTAMSFPYTMMSVTLGETLIMKCNQKFGENTDARFWKSSIGSNQSISTCVNETLSDLVTQWPSDGVLLYSDLIPLDFKSRLAATAVFDLIIQNASILDSGCFTCGQVNQKQEEQLDDPIVVIVNQGENGDVIKHDERDGTDSDDNGFKQGSNRERLSTALWIFLSIVALAFITAVIVVTFIRVTGRSMHPIRWNLHMTKINAVLEDLTSKHIFEWTAAYLKELEENTMTKRDILHHINGYLRRNNDRKHNEVVHIETSSEIPRIQRRLEDFTDETLKSQVAHGRTENDVIFSLFCTASLAGMATYEHRKKCTVTLKLLEPCDTLDSEAAPLFVTENSQVAGSYRSLVLEYFFGRLLWAELQTLRKEDLLPVTKNICKRILVYMEFLNDNIDQKQATDTTLLRKVYIPPPGRKMYENLTSSAADGRDLNALNTTYLIKLIARMHDDINKEILMYDILLSVIFARPSKHKAKFTVADETDRDDI
ncbi:uncharacterized protein [Diadema antillarum]|uniref:uncharacterized protein n=1 Tax=Diadema antillarum TaxID=105358 RepID=UPI003A8960C4